MKMKPILQHTLLSICCGHLALLTACGGGGSGGMVRPGPAQTVTSPPPPTSSRPLCASPITADCIVDTRPSTGGDQMTGGRQSDYALIKRGSTWTFLSDGEFRFSGGTVVEGLGLGITSTSVLQSNVTVQQAGHLSLGGTIRGSVANHGTVYFGPQACEPFPCLAPSRARIEGDYRQSATGTLNAALGGTLQITGRADLDGGTLVVSALLDWDRGYALPTTPSSQQLLHADGGVFGQFGQWRPDTGLFITGNLRYGSHDVFFDLTRISTESAMTAGGASDAMTLASAASLDAAFASADRYAGQSGLSDVQRRFLASGASIQHIADVAQATRSLDSLSGQAHALAQDVVHAQTAATVAQLDARLDRLPRGSLQGGMWSAPLAHHGRIGGSYDVDGQASGFDRWLGPHWLIGGSVAQAQAQMQFERMGGHGRGDSPMASVYAHYRGDDWHATGVVGAGRTTLQLDRPIDLGAAGTHLAQSRRGIGQVFLHGELGRRVAFGNGRLTPFAALDYTALRSDGFREQGDTGFELVAQPGHTTQWSAAVGARYAQDWHLGARGWLRLDLDARYQQRLAGGGALQQAAFVGTPDALFDLTAWSRAEDVATMNLGLAGGFDDRWSWSLDYARRFGGAAPQGGWFAGLRREF